MLRLVSGLPFTYRGVPCVMESVVGPHILVSVCSLVMFFVIQCVQHCL